MTSVCVCAWFDWYWFCQMLTFQYYYYIVASRPVHDYNVNDIPQSCKICCRRPCICHHLASYWVVSYTLVKTLWTTDQIEWKKNNNNKLFHCSAVKNKLPDNWVENNLHCKWNFRCKLNLFFIALHWQV